MLIDNKFVFMSDVAIATAATPVGIDMYGEDIAVYPNSNLRKKSARGIATTMLVHGVIKRGGTGSTAFSGSVVAKIYIDDVDGETTVVRSDTVLCTDAEHDGVHFTMEIPRHREGRYVGFAIDDTSIVGGGSANVVDAWAFVL